MTDQIQTPPEQSDCRPLKRGLDVIKRDLDEAWAKASDDPQVVYLLVCCVENLWRIVSELEEERHS